MEHPTRAREQATGSVAGSKDADADAADPQGTAGLAQGSTHGGAKSPFFDDAVLRLQQLGTNVV